MQNSNDISTPDMSEYFLKEYEKSSMKDRDLYLGGTIVTAVVAGRFV